jgi:hypothetical protein
MALDLSLRRWLVLPRFIQTGNGDPRKAHYLGNQKATSIDGKQDQGKQEQPPNQPDTQKYRSLESITLGEVKQVADYFQPQLVPSPMAEWVAKNYFCQLPLDRKPNRPSVVFGRVVTSFPSDGNIQNIEEMELHFPRRQAAPDLLQLLPDDLALHKPIQSFCVGVKMYLSESEQQDFSRSENIFIEKGFAPLYEAGYSDLLDLNEQNRQPYWLYVFGSEWFASIPDSMQLEMKEKLLSLVRWKRTVLNYHPKRYTLRYRSLNDELDFQYDFSDDYLVMPQDVGQVLTKVEQKFEQSFIKGMA